MGGVEIRIQVLGDSLATHADFRGLPKQDAFQADLRAALSDLGYLVQTIDYAQSGSTTADGLARLEAFLAGGGSKGLPDGAIVELGTNDALKQLSIAGAEDNLRQILQLYEDNGVKVLLTGAYGYYPTRKQGYTDPDDVAAFEDIYPRLAEEFGTGLYPFFLDGVLDDPARYTSDGLHPNPEGVDVIVAGILPKVEELIDATGLVPTVGDPVADPFQLTAGTFALWFQPDHLSGQQGLLSRDAGGYGDGGHMTLYLDGGGVNLRLQDTSMTHQLASARDAVRVGEPNHVAFSFGSEGAKLYLNGLLVDADGYAGGLAGNTEPLVVGALAWGSGTGQANNLQGFFDGVIDEIAVFDRVLDTDTVLALYDAGVGAGGGLDTLVDNGSGTVIA